MGQGGSENGENQINLGYILQIKPKGCGGKLNMGEKKTKASKKRICLNNQVDLLREGRLETGKDQIRSVRVS